MSTIEIESNKMKNPKENTEAKSVVEERTPRRGVPTVKAEFREVEIALIMASATNPRKSFPAEPMAELTESIKLYGVKQPPLIRFLTRYEVIEPDLTEKRWHIVAHEPDGLKSHSYYETRTQASDFMDKQARGRDGKEFEIVCGERRYRAALAAGLKRIPCMIEALGDKEAQEIQAIENLQREDLNPIEEAEGYKRLMESHGSTVKDLQARLGRSRSHIFAKLALLKLAPAVRKALEESKIEASVAELVGRFEVKQQEKALEKLLVDGERYDNGKKIYVAVSFRDAKRILENVETTISLKEAKGKFDLDGVYAPEPKGNKATECLPICATCPHRSGNCADEWPDLTSPDVCTRPSCFHQKASIAGAAKLAGFAAKGLKTVGLAQSQKLFTSWGGFTSSAYVKPDQRVYADKKRRTVAEILGKSTPEPVVMLDLKHSPVRVYPAKEVQALLAEKGITEKKKSSNDYAAERKASQEREKALAPKMLEAVRGVLGKGGNDAVLQVALVKEIECQCEPDFEEVLELLDVDGKVEQFAKVAKPRDLIAAILLALCYGWDGLQYDNVHQLGIHLGVDVKAIEKAYDAKKAEVDTKGTKGTDKTAKQAKDAKGGGK